MSVSNLPNKKYMVKFLNKFTNKINTIHFGAAGFNDYILTNDDGRKKAYLQRHKNDNINDLSYAGCWAANLLWNKTSMTASIKDMERRFGINIIY